MVTQGTVTDRKAGSDPDWGDSYSITCEFTDGFLQPSETWGVDRPTYDSLKKGDKVAIIYVPGKPWTARLESHFEGMASRFEGEDDSWMTRGEEWLRQQTEKTRAKLAKCNLVRLLWTVGLATTVLWVVLLSLSALPETPPWFSALIYFCQVPSLVAGLGMICVAFLVSREDR